MSVASTVQQALHPFFIMCFILGLGFGSTKQTKSKIQWIIYLNILYSLIFWLAYVYLLYYTVTAFTWTVLFGPILNSVLSMLNMFTSIMSAIMSFYHRKRFEIFMKKLAIVDDTLEELGTPKMYQNMYMKSKRMIIGWIMYSLIINFYDIIKWLNTEETSSSGLFLSHILNHCFHINALIDLLFIFFMWYIGTRFDKINEHMRCLLVKEHGLWCTWEKPAVMSRRRISYTDDYKRTLWISMHLHLELCRLTRELNIIFETHMTSELTSSVPYLAAMFYYIYMMIMKRTPEKLTAYDWFDLIEVNPEFQAKEINKIIHQLTNILRYADIWKEVHQFILQEMHHPLKLSAMGFFYLGNDFLRKLCMTLVTFMIIMIQFKVPISDF